MPEQDGDKTTDPGPVDRSAGAAAEASDVDYVRATTPVRSRLVWQVMIWPVLMIVLVIAGAVWVLS